MSAQNPVPAPPEPIRDEPSVESGPGSRGRPGSLLRRSRDNRVLFGVCGGLGRYLGIDPVIVRIAVVALTVFGGSGVVLYLIGLVAIPEEPEGGMDSAASLPGAQQGVGLVGAALVVVGVLLLARTLLPDLTPLVGPILLIGVGAAVILGSRR
jgi:phage shock protein C